jgi:outer membrane protein OmpA-like peptidoglycan-associated protein
MKKLYFFALLFGMLPVVFPAAQTNDKAKILYEQANIAFRERNFKKGFDLMDKAIEKDPNFAEAYYKLGNVYEFTFGEQGKAIPYYEKALVLKPDFNGFIAAYQTLAYRYLQDGKYDLAKAHFEKFIDLKPGKELQVREARRQLANIEFARNAMQNPVSFKPKSLGKTINKYQLQYFPVLTADKSKLFFTSRATNTHESDENLMVSNWTGDSWGTPESVSKMINTAFNEGTCSISADGRTLVFTCCQGRETYGSCDLFVTFKNGSEWSVPENMGPKINTMAWESQPSLSADGRTIFFVSDRQGGYGRRDIWMSTLDNDGYWQKPVNLGKNVNTPYDDLSPFIHVNGRTLYFSSQGHPSLGGYDLYSVDLLGNQWGNVKNLGYPLNTYLDEVSLFVTSDGKKGYYAFESKNEHVLQSSELYEFDIPEQIELKYTSDFLKGIVYDSKTKNRLDAKIELFDVGKDSLVALMNSDAKTGEYLTVLTKGSEYALYVNRPGYLFKSLYFNHKDTAKTAENLILDIYLTPIEKGAKETLNNLFFATNEYKLDGKSVTEIEKIIRFMGEYQNLILEISGHTDDVDTDEYNQKLSEKRAKSVYDYLIARGMNPLRLKYAGYGEKQPAYPNNSDKNRALNRRIEFKVLQK